MPPELSTNVGKIYERVVQVIIWKILRWVLLLAAAGLLFTYYMYTTSAQELLVDLGYQTDICVPPDAVTRLLLIVGSIVGLVSAVAFVVPVAITNGILDMEPSTCRELR